MAEAVGRCISAGTHLQVRAGTGTGKSLAYLVPAVLSGKRVVVATATKALQDQLASKDLPLVARGIGRRLSFAVLKGRSNYLCAQRVREAGLLGAQGELGDVRGRPGSPGAADQARAVLEWAGTTETGDRAELPLEPDPRVWSALSVSAEECPGAFRCPSGGECFAEAARARAAASDVVIVNLHLLGADLASGGAVLPEHDALVVDEAHELEDVLSASLGVTVGEGRVRAVAAAARSALGGRPGSPAAAIVDDVLDAAGRLGRALEARVGERVRPGLTGELSDAVALLSSRLERLGSELHRAAGTRAAGAPVEGGAAGAGGDDEQRAVRAASAVGHVREDLARFSALDDEQVAWVEGGPRPALEVAPLDVAAVLAERVFSRIPVVLTSATLPPGFASRLGADADGTEVLDVGSPFDYERHAVLYCAAHLPDRRRPEAEAAIADELVALIDAAGGRALALFTSRAAMERAAAAVAPRVAHPILVQGERPKAALVEEFRSAPEACLFATMGFWQGVDVPGATLSLVVIDRIPFSRPDDPLAAARRERAGAEAFRSVDLPRAASLLAQGAGRLVRTAEDRGVVAVLDSRLATATYRWDLVRSLPPMRRTRDRSEAEAFLRAIREGDAAGASRSRARADGSRARLDGLSSRGAR